MKTRFLLALTAFFLAANSAISRADIAWESDYNSALSKSRTTGKPLFVDFYTDWCGWCKKLDSDVYPDPQFQQTAASFVMLKLNAEGAGAPQAKAFGVSGFPTILFLSPQGRQIHRIPGYMKASDFVSVMRQVLQKSASQPRPATASETATKNAATLPKTGNPALNRTGYTPGAGDWRSQPELRRAAGSDNYGGAFLLDENGVTALDLPAKKKIVPAKTAAKSKKSGAKNQAKRVRR